MPANQCPTRAPIVVALGGNAISPPGGRGDIAEQFAQTRKSVVPLADLIEHGYPLVITHGNGPQVGAALRRVELSLHEVYPLDLGICVADLQGGMGYMIAQCLNNELTRRGLERKVTALVTSVEVDADDPAFEDPTKPIGSWLTQETAEQYIANHGWRVREFSHGWRRVVPSPLPRRVRGIHVFRKLLDLGETLIAAGGGGAPVVRSPNGELEGVEAVIDKDRASSLLARELGAERLVMLTGVEQVCVDFGTEQARPVDRMTVAEARQHLGAGQFPAGTMGPKIEAAVDFVEGSGPEARVTITDLDHVAAAIDGSAGTTVTH